ncbi:MAG: aromatic ring-hydroxylating dioxygenase subunit alpha, partial [Gammaproteobacteria bacterium]|nr:aromatic ring-hydroxylating dioxygenase subunit alpha [Gammaproteobacteria bacterium]
SQRPIAVHALEHRGRTDKGVIMLRRALRDRIRGLARGEDPHSHVPADGSPIRTYTHDTVLWAPREENGDDRRRLRGLADRVTDIVTGFDELAIDERQERIESELAKLSCRRETP